MMRLNMLVQTLYFLYFCVRGQNEDLAEGVVTNLGEVISDISVPFVTSRRPDLQISIF